MKTLLVLSLLCSFYRSVAQDTIVMTDGMELPVKVVEVDNQTVFYIKYDKVEGPVTRISRAKIFMIIYKNGAREVFDPSPELSERPDHVTTAGNQAKESPVFEISNGTFQVRLIEAKNKSDKSGKSVLVSASVRAYAGSQLFGVFTVSAFQRIDLPLDYTRVNGRYLGKSQVTIIPESERLSTILFEKYENYKGKGYGLALPPGFFSAQPSSCTVAYLEQKEENKEILGWGGLSDVKHKLHDCTSLENKLLSIALLWLEINFGKK